MVAGKTGTTNDFRDSWFAGFSDSHLGVVWLGRDDNSTISLTGSTGALRVWANLIREIESGNLEQAEPGNITWARIDTRTLQPASPLNGESTVLPFVSGTEPSSIWSKPVINMRSIEDEAKKILDSINDLIR